MLRNYREMTDFCQAQGFAQVGGPTGDDYSLIRLTEDGSQLALFLVNLLYNAAIGSGLSQIAAIMRDALDAIKLGIPSEAWDKLVEEIPE